MVRPPIEPIILAAVNDVASPTAPAAPVSKVDPAGNPFDAVLGKAIDALNGVSQTEFTANKLIDDYIAGKAELSDVMIATSKMTIAVNLAVSTITSAVSSFKEITQMAI
jgi:flagellar hook-basal body complex protein FliE